MNRRLFLKRILASSLAATVPTPMFCSKMGSRSKRPNFIIFLSDDLGYGDLACYGNPIIRTPHIDKFASQGMRFTDCHSAGTVCSPSRASLLTGRNPFRSGFYYILGGGVHLKREEITIASLLQKDGYDTCFVGKWHLSRFDRETSDQPCPGDHGFDHWFATAVNAFEGPQNPKTFFRNGQKVGEVDGWYCDVIVQEAVHWLKHRPDPEKPFFLLVCSHEPHTPLAPPESYAEVYDNPETNRLEKSIRYGGVQRPGKDITHLRNHYYGTVAQLDHAFGRFMQEIDNMNLGDNSLAFFTSDNGPESPVNLEESRGEWEDPLRDRCFGTPGVLRGMKRYPYEGGHRVPGIARWPGYIKPGSISDELINGTDFLPTMCELSGITIPHDRNIDGVSMLPAFQEDMIHRPEPVCWFFPPHEDTHYRMPHMAMREGKYVLLGWFRAKEKEQLIMDWIKTTRLHKFEMYNIKIDPEQTRDLSEIESERMRNTIIRMKKRWKEIQEEGPYWPDWKMK